MRSVGSAVSLTAHVVLVAVVVLGTANARPKEAARPIPLPMVFAQVVPRHVHGGFPVPDGSATVEIPSIPAPTIPVWTGTATQSLPPLPFPGAAIDGDHDIGMSGLFSATGPEVLSGPLPRYPELLRQAGIQGRVMLEATVDTTGRVQPGSVTVVSATNPAFVEPAREALLATLFRPAQVGGRVSRMRVRIPFEFTLKNGTAPIR
jgi:TonB family protein